MTREDILTEIRRTANENGGTPLGTDRFLAETGIKTSDWQGKFWARWGDALVEAGFKPNQLQGPRSEQELLGALASLARELGHFPVANEIKLKARTEAGFPWHNTFTKFGGKHSLAARLHDFCSNRGEEDVAAMCDAVVSRNSRSTPTAEDAETGTTTQLGYVYLIKHGTRREYKIGRTNNMLRREGEIGIELPERIEPIHVIETDDPAGIEAYWHRRFADKQLRNEWFQLTTDDVKAFKRWRRIS